MALLLTSEIVTNAVRFSVGAVTLTLSSNGVLRVEVQDDAVALPVARPTSLMAEGGRGLVIVEALADDWGSWSRDDSKTVWFSLLLPRSSQRADMAAGQA